MEPSEKEGRKEGEREEGKGKGKKVRESRSLKARSLGTVGFQPAPLL